jgi:hypothetical protein
MTYEQAKARLLNHANLAGAGIADEESFLFALWKAEKEKILPNFDALYEDVLTSLEVVNRHLNSGTPSEVVRGKASQLERSLVNSMWYVTHDGWRFQRRWDLERIFERDVTEHLALLLYRISCAWGAVLDGDVDSLREHIQNEEIASNRAS